MRRSVDMLVTLALASCGSGHPPESGADAEVETCAHTPGDPASVGTIHDIGNDELSGLAASHTIADLLWTHGDSGGAAEVYSVSGVNATVHGTLRVEAATNIDWEDIDTAPCSAGHCIYVADTGDNDLVRTSVALYEIVEPAADPIGTVDVAATRYDIAYPDGPHNVEGVFVDPRDGTAYGIEKVTTNLAAVYSLPRAPTQTTAVLVGHVTIPADDPRVTGADMSVDSCSARIAILTYNKLYELRGDASTSVVDLLGGALGSLPMANEPHGEAIGYAADGHAYFTTSEGSDPKLHRVSD